MNRKMEPKRVRTEKLSISLPTEMVKWINEMAEAEENGNVSACIRRQLHARFLSERAGKQRAKR
jgi:Arc/MetJ-type ribon-helix-helix transcriptional regulator